MVWLVVCMPLFLAAVGLALDGGVVFNARRELQNVADAAARAGAMQLDERVYRESAGARLVLDQEGARRVAVDYLAERPGLSGEVRSDERRVVVAVSRDVPLAFLRVVGFDRVRISATAPAEARVGIERGNP
jgi:Flp pilus assembly protein TadG